MNQQRAYGAQQLEQNGSLPQPTSASVGQEHEPNPGEAISAPSILGLANTAEEHSSDFSYLYDAEPRRGYGRLIIALLVLAAFGAFLFYQREQLPTWYAAIVKRQNAQSAAPVQAPSPVASTGSSMPLPSASSQSVPDQSAAETNTVSSNAPSSTIGAPKNPLSGTASGDATQPSPAQGNGNPSSAATPSPEAGPSPAAEIQPSKSQPSGNAKATDAQEETTNATALAASREGRGGKTVVPRDASEELASRGQAYLYGNGVARSCNQALIYLRKAADMGNAQARSQLGALYATGHCVPLDRARAYNWFSLAESAASGHNIWIERNRQMLWDQMTDAERARALGAQ